MGLIFPLMFVSGCGGGVGIGQTSPSNIKFSGTLAGISPTTLPLFESSFLQAAKLNEAAATVAVLMIRIMPQIDPFLL